MTVTPRVAFVVDALPGLGGSEKVLLAALELFPSAPIYTLVYNRPAFAQTTVATRTVKTSFIDHLPLVQSQYRKYLPLMPRAIEQFDLGAYELILSFSYAVAHGVRTCPGQRHLSYTYTPMRYAWRGIGINGLPQSPRYLSELFFRIFRAWDSAAVQHIDQMVAVSHWIADWVCRAYGRTARVIYPPVDTDRFHPQPVRDKFYITVSRLVRHKRLDLIVDAFNRLKLPLIIVGEGPDERRLQARACSNIHLVGYQSDTVVADLLGRARGFICACEEDFGIAAVEAQAAGCPVIAYRKGGSLETVIDGETGLFFDPQTPEALAETITSFEKDMKKFAVPILHANAEKFNKENFQRNFVRFVQEAGKL